MPPLGIVQEYVPDKTGLNVEAFAYGRPHRTPEFIDLMDFETRRARQYYRDALPLLDHVDRRSRAALGALVSIYSRLLDRIEQSNYDVFSRRISLSAAEKSRIVIRAVCGARANSR